jgi:hypothetical protein
MTNNKNNKKGSSTVSQFARNSSSCIGLLGLGSLAFTLPLSVQADGFIEDAKATLNLRNAYFNRNFTNPTNPQGAAVVGAQDRQHWHPFADLQFSLR